jgi:hypothetical protein
MFAWFAEHGYEADLDSLREAHPTPVTFEAWLRRNGWGEPAGAPSER